MRYLVIALVLLGLLAALVFIAFKPGATAAGPGRKLRYDRKRLLTPNELEFYHRLLLAAPEDYVVLTQVAMGALLDAKKDIEGLDRRRVRNSFDRKIVDYALLHAETGEVTLLIELDDRTHRSEKDEARDAMTKEAGYRTLRFESRKKPSAEDLRIALDRALLI